jgi:hypothetical protein
VPFVVKILSSLNFQTVLLPNKKLLEFKQKNEKESSKTRLKKNQPKFKHTKPQKSILVDLKVNFVNK